PIHALSLNGSAYSVIYTLSLHDALPICSLGSVLASSLPAGRDKKKSERSSNSSPHIPMRPGCGATTGPPVTFRVRRGHRWRLHRSEEHTSELQSPDHLVCRLLLEKKNKG